MNPIILGDFKEYEKLPEADYQKAFENARYHGLDNSIYPFAIGGSDIAAIYGESPWNTPLDLFYLKTKKKRFNEAPENVEAKRTGHRAEPYVLDMYKDVTGREAIANSLQVRHPDEKYSHCVANVDGFIYDEEVGEVGIYEGKTTSGSNFPAIKDWKAGKVPRYYDLQVRFYMAIWDLNYADIYCAWGLRPSESACVRIHREKDIEEAILEDAETFVEIIKAGHEPSMSCVKSGTLVSKALDRIYGPADPTLPTVKLDPKTETALAAIIEIDNQINEIKVKRNILDKEIREYEKKRTGVFAPIVTELKTATKGELIVTDCKYDITYESTGRYSVDKDILKEKYPVIFDEVYLPSQNRILSITKLDK